MPSVLLKIIPLDISSTLSPGLLTVALFLLGNKAHPKTRALAFLIGSALVGICASLLGLSLGQTASDHLGPTKASSIIDLIVGIIFLGFAVGILFVKEKELKIKPSYRKNDHIISRWFLVGFVMTVINFDAVFFNFTAAREVGSAQLEFYATTGLIIMNILFFTLPLYLPILIYMLMPKTAGKSLNKLNGCVMNYGKYIISVFSFIFGFWLLYDAIQFFLGQ